MREKRSNYSLMAKVFHWGFIVLFGYGLIKAVEDLDQLDDYFFLRFEVLFALAFLLLLIARFVYMKKTQETSLPENTSSIQKLIARIVHMGMYVTLAVIASTGLIIGLLFQLGLENSFLIKTVIAIHEFGIPVMYWLIGFHVLAAVYHRLLGDGVWSSMVPFWKED